MKIIMASLLLLALTVPAFAQHPEGQWGGEGTNYHKPGIPPDPHDKTVIPYPFRVIIDQLIEGQKAGVAEYLKFGYVADLIFSHFHNGEYHFLERCATKKMCNAKSANGTMSLKYLKTDPNTMEWTWFPQGSLLPTASGKLQRLDPLGARYNNKQIGPKQKGDSGGTTPTPAVQ